MHSNSRTLSIEFWLAEVRSEFESKARELLPLFEVYAAEALFGRRYIDADLKGLNRPARVIEIGAGSLLLSCQLMREGYEVTALEPTSLGFSHFTQMQLIILEKAGKLGCCPPIWDFPAETLTDRSGFDYAFSINVMEHVENVALVIYNVGNSLAAGAVYRFTCPNYLFPYEPHFNIPTFFSKKMTEKMLGKRIFASQRVSDPNGTWQSLNWITVLQVRRIVRKLPWLKLSFNRMVLALTLERIATDSIFAGRRSTFVRVFILTAVRSRVHNLLRLMPAALQPVMDCRLEKTIVKEKVDLCPR
ncbi:MAG: hypothetical protein A3J24_00695 [Deltaproteobacteria bacterium RIFCSPLOWO2_02_FULL_53_8]|nr:MAG: hypothetical protein A3J24_00695 [Deltaproteobacteria bacterium RIFCSPLOWO2_02_FULL_53_8]